jgi:ParB-like nuclease domain
MNAPANPGQFQRVQRGPQVGAPPSLEQIPVDRLEVDPAYQRATDGPQSRKIINDMIKQWDWSLCQPLVVARRADGRLYILDGQHRHQGAVQRGDILFLPCVVLSSLDHAGEARTFVALNTRRQKLTEAEVFNGMLAAGDPHAKAAQDLLDETGWTVVRHSNTSAYKAGELQCAPMLARQIRINGPDQVRFALSILRASYPDKPVTVAATLLKALFIVFDDMARPEPGYDTKQLVEALGAVRPTDWITRALIRREKFTHLSQISALAECLGDAARGDDVPSVKPVIARRVEPARALESVARPAPPRLSAASPFGSTGKGWCEQCEQLRSREAAAACISKFCKLRGFA